MAQWTWQVDGAITRLDRTLMQAIEEGLGQWDGDPVAISRSQIQRLIEQEKVWIDGKKAVFNSKLAAGSEIRIQFPPPLSVDIVPENIPIDVLFEDKHLLVLNKPAGLTVHPSETQRTGTLVHGLLHHIKDLSGIGGELRPGIVHRIDKNTSGALVVTKTDDAHRKLVEVFAAHEIDRVYWALAYGSPAADEGKIVTRIDRNPNDRKKMGVVEEGGREAVTHYKRLQAYGLTGAGRKPFASWIEARLETGRTHQVRVHLTHIGNSLLGDTTYGLPGAHQSKWQALPRDIQNLVKSLPGQALHARVLGFEHPITGEKLRFEAEPPAAFTELVNALKKFD
jgi:23S rRNA pseudouridine1911/1915/1917 synthase